MIYAKFIAMQRLVVP